MTSSRVKASSRVKGGPERAFRRAGHRLAVAGLLACVSVPGLLTGSLAGVLGTIPASEAPDAAAQGPASPQPSGGPQSIMPSDMPAAPLPEVGEQGTPVSPGNTFPGGIDPASPPVTRTLTGVPGRANSDITVGTLSGVDASSAGLLGAGDGGFGPLMWQGATRGDVERYLPELPAASGSPIMNDLSRRLLLTSAQPPADETPGVSLLAIRLERLIASGHADKAWDLARNAQADVSPPVSVARARAALAVGKDAQACEALGDIPTGSDPAHDEVAAFSTKLSALCQLAAGHMEAANLTLDLAREEGYDDPLFSSLVLQAANGLTLKADEPTKLDVLDIALYRLAKRDLPANAGAIAELAAVQALSRDQTLPVDTRIQAGERAAMLGLIGGTELAGLYRLVNFTPEEKEGLHTGTYPASAMLRRALVFQAIEAEAVPQARARLIKLMLATGQGSGLTLPVIEVLRPILTSIAPSPDMRDLAPAAVRAFLLVDDRPRAEQWYGLVVPPGATRPQGLALGRDARELSALMRMSDPAGPGGDPDQLTTDIRADLNSGVQATRMFGAREAALLEALGYPLPAELRDALVRLRVIDQAAASPAGISLARLRDAGQRHAVGQTVMFSLILLGSGGPGGADRETVAQSVSSLKAVQLGDEARRLATEALMGRSHAAPG